MLRFSYLNKFLMLKRTILTIEMYFELSSSSKTELSNMWASYWNNNHLQCPLITKQLIIL